MELNNDSSYTISNQIEHNAEEINEIPNEEVVNDGEDIDIQNISNEYGNLNFQEITKEQIIQSVKEKFPNSKIIPFNELVSTVISIFGVASIEYYKESAIMSKTCNKYLSETDLDLLMTTLLTSEGLSAALNIILNEQLSSRLKFEYELDTGEGYISIKKANN